MHVTFISVKYEGDYGDEKHYFFFDIKISNSSLYFLS